MDSDALPDIRLKCPDLASIIPGRRFLYRAKVGGERQTVTVTASTAPYPRDFGKGRKAMYVNVYGYEGKWDGSRKQTEDCGESIAPHAPPSPGGAFHTPPSYWRTS